MKHARYILVIALCLTSSATGMYCLNERYAPKTLMEQLKDSSFKELLESEKLNFTPICCGDTVFTSFNWSQLNFESCSSGSFRIKAEYLFFDETDRYCTISYALVDRLERIRRENSGFIHTVKRCNNPEVIRIDTETRMFKHNIPNYHPFITSITDEPEQNGPTYSARNITYPSPIEFIGLNKALTMGVVCCDNGVTFLVTVYQKPIPHRKKLHDVAIHFE